MRRRHLALVTLLVLAGCARGGAQDGRLDVVASFYPLAFIAQRVGGEHVAVRNLTPPGAEPHDLELTPGQIDALRRADLVLYFGGGFQAPVQQAASSARHAFDALPAARPRADASGVDPHVWLDPVRMRSLADAIASRLAAADEPHAGAFRRRASALDADLAELDRAYATGLRACVRHEIVTSHAAFGYLAGRYGLRQIAIAGLDPEAEPTPRRLHEVVALARRYRATTIFYESLVSPKIAQTVAREVKVRTDVLDPIEGVRGTDTYLTVMRRNLDRLRSALQCT